MESDVELLTNQLLEVILLDPVALVKWRCVIEHIVSRPVDRLLATSLYDVNKYEQSIRTSLRQWIGDRNKRADLRAKLEQTGLCRLAELLAPKLHELDALLALPRLYGDAFAASTRGIAFGLNFVPDNFAGRATEMDTLGQLVASASITYISGLGGVGKSTLALKFAVDNAECFHGNLIVINGESKQSIDKSFRGVSELKEFNGLEDKDMTDEQRRSEVYKFFSRGNCLFLFDNVETLGFENANENSLNHFLPRDDGKNMIKVVVTTRVNTTGEQNAIQLGVLTEAESLEFIKANLPREILEFEDDEAIQSLNDVLGQLPLALQQAVASIRYMQLHEKPISHYLHSMKFLKKKLSLLTCSKFTRTPIMYAKTVYTTWEITLEQIRENYDAKLGALAVHIIQLLAYMNPYNIPISIFNESVVKDSGDDAEAEEAKSLIYDAVTLLMDYSLVNHDNRERGGYLSIHRLVQEVIRVRIEMSGNEFSTLKSAMKLFVRSGVELNPEGLHDFWSLRADRNDELPHGRSLINYIIRHDDLLRDSPLFPTNLSYKLDLAGKHQDAMEVVQTCIPKYDVLFPNSRALLKLRERFANSLEYSGRFEESLAELKAVYPVCVQLFRESDSQTIIVAINHLLALVYTERYSQALDDFKRLLQNPRIAASLCVQVDDVNHALLNSCVQSLDKVQILEYVCGTQMEIQRREGWPDIQTHPSVLRTKLLIARELQGRGDAGLTRAREILTHVLEGTTRNYGIHHTETRHIQAFLQGL